MLPRSHIHVISECYYKFITLHKKKIGITTHKNIFVDVFFIREYGLLES